MSNTTHSNSSIATGHVALQRELPHEPAAVYAAWSRREALQRWGHPGSGWWLAFDRFTFRVGQSDLCRFGPEGEPGFVNENRYLALEPQRRIVYASTLAPAGDAPQAPSFAGVVAVEIEALPGGGSRLRFQETGLYFDGGADDEAGHQAGWEQMLDQLAAYLDAQQQAQQQQQT
ncbi:ATPase [Roseateles sp. DAIF2]|uniref:SRPBCC domain-containing protein n=1 Tax=Roseateles sp. DAIF2 TaxID=2714952 RepID=UPI0018A2BA8A|nr:SRPBCC domain-containing protein [Roseateles sp. DAIF2]QPF72228.1 ATPase [Roseateles sp. DAIF2]